jgi:hypothetical protein
MDRLFELLRDEARVENTHIIALSKFILQTEE